MVICDTCTDFIYIAKTKQNTVAAHSCNTMTTVYLLRGWINLTSLFRLLKINQSTSSQVYSLV